MKALLLLPLLLLFSCGSKPEVVSSSVTESKYPVYCIRDVITLSEDRVLLDMPGYPFGMDDKYQEISTESLNEIKQTIDGCKPGDPRMEVEPVGIAWSNGYDTKLDQITPL